MNKSWKNKIRRFFPGIIAGGADNDPAGIATYALSGAQFGYHQLWLMVWATPMLIAVQAMCARLGLVKKQGLTTIIRQHYSPAFVFIAATVLIIANVLTIGADLTGVAAAAELVTHVNYIYFVVPVALVLWLIVLFGNFKLINRYLLVLSSIFITYILAALLSKPNWWDVIRNLIVPTISVSPNFLLAGVGLLGTTITPYLFFWQAQEEVEENPSKAEAKIEVKKTDTILAPGFIFSNIISIFIMIATASVLNSRGITDLKTIAGAAAALEPFAGKLSTYLFAFGIIGSGLLAIPILAASASAAIAEVFGWRESLSDKLNRAKGFYTVLTIALLVGAAIALLGIDPISALFYSQVMDGILGPILVVFVLFLCNDKKVMGEHVNNWFDNFFGWMAVVVMVLATAGFFWQWLKPLSLSW